MEGVDTKIKWVEAVSCFYPLFSRDDWIRTEYSNRAELHPECSRLPTMRITLLRCKGKEKMVNYQMSP